MKKKKSVKKKHVAKKRPGARAGGNPEASIRRVGQ